MIQCMIQFYQEKDWIDFRYAELNAVLKLIGLDYSDLYDFSNLSSEQKNSPYLKIQLPDLESIAFICSRCVLIKAIYEFWCDGTSLAEIIRQLHSLTASSSLLRCFEANSSWSIQIDAYYRKFTLEERQNYLDKFNGLGFKGNFDVLKPDAKLFLLMDFSHFKQTNQKLTFCPDPEGLYCFFGQQLSIGGMREELKKYSLKSRLYLGPTSLDTSLSFIMMNIAGVQRGSVVLDPFVGTASLLITAAHHGALCFGTDIDIRVLKGNMYAGQSRDNTDSDREMKRDIWENFRVYGLAKPELIRLDNHLLDRHLNYPINHECDTHNLNYNFYDSIITDPPYSIRAGAKKSGKKGGVRYIVNEDSREQHIPATQTYPVEEVMLDLLHNSAKLLKMNGILAYLIPTPYDFNVSDLPIHPCFELKDICLQNLSSRHGRRLVVLKKIHEYTKDKLETFNEYKESVLLGKDGNFSLLIKKLAASLASDAHANVEVVKKISRTKEKRMNNTVNRIAWRNSQSEIS